MLDTKLKDLNDMILYLYIINCELAVIRGTGHTSYYDANTLQKYEVNAEKNYIKNHIA